MTKAWLDDPVMRNIVLAGPQMARAAQPDEIVGMVLYLASPLASFVPAESMWWTAARPPTESYHQCSTTGRIWSRHE
jgi:NAD(P)-dependent dehydrogenase (short-subunit alcohol dehydrogenase family)